MRLMRNTTDDGTCKYAIIRLDKLRTDAEARNMDAVYILDFLLDNRSTLPSYYASVLAANYLELGKIGDPEECFVIKLKDQNAAFALEQYANSARSNGMLELADDVMQLAERSRTMTTKRPD